MNEDANETAPGAPAGAAAGVTGFPCSNCGATMLFAPGTRHLACPYCGTENDIPVGEDEESKAYLKENDFLAALENEEQGRQDAAATAEAVRCTSCGATTTLSTERTSERCPYCGSPLSHQNRQRIKIDVQAMLPFAVNSDKAMETYRGWLASRWFAPSDFARRATREKSLDGVYMPYWTFDSDTRTDYRGQRGDAYYVTESYYVTVNGKQEQRTRQVRHIRWSFASGVVNVSFDDVLTPASQSLPVHLADKLAPWELARLQPFSQEFLAGFVTESYQIGLRDGFQDAKAHMAPTIDSAIRNDIGGDEQRIDSAQTAYSNVTYKHILLPVWLSAYAYGGKTFRFMINAQTGAITGERPWSWWKIGLAVAAGLAAAAGLFYLLQNMQ